MSIITIFSSGFCNEAPIIDQIVARTGYREISDDLIVAEASRRSGIPENKIKRAFSTETSVFNKFTHEKERSIAFVKQVLAEMVADDDVVVTNFSGQLIPKSVSHALRLCLIAPMKYRIETASQQEAVSEKEATRMVHSREEDCIYWMKTICQAKDPWDPAFYDIVIPVDKTTIAEAADLVMEHVDTDVVKSTPESEQALKDFHIAAETEVALTLEGHHVDVSADRGVITLTINKHVLMLNRLKDELKSIVEKIQGVESIEITIGQGFHKTDIYRKHDFKMPSKILLVDDEREYVKTLSERLILREMGSAVAYDGESALNLIQKDDPEVIIVDLKMPGIDGFDVLQKVKESRPDIEVIILTGHGNDADGRRCMEMGAFAYLQKPLDINELSETIKAANEKIRQRKAETDGHK
jgi:CheY-like chemotaxis protein